MSNLSEWDIGDAVRMRTTFKVGDTPTNPTDVNLIVTDPSGNQDTYTMGQLTNEATGIWYRDVMVDEIGEWAWRMVGTGAVDAVFAERIVVKRQLA